VDYLEDNFGNENNATVQIKNNGLTNDKTPVLVGTATPGSVIEILENGIPLSGVNPPVADATGRWTFNIPSAFFGDGKHTYEIRTTSKSGNIVKAYFNVDVDTNAPSVGSIDSVEDTVPPQLGPIQQNGLTNDSSPVLRGKAEASGTVTIYDKSNGQVVGIVKAGLDGTWTYKAIELDDGIHSFVITVTDAAGNVSAESPAFNIKVDTFVPPAMNLANVQLIDDVGTLQGNLSSGDIT
ncbi:Ig-like domain-containing protein, partial [Thorsellia kenyensis]